MTIQIPSVEESAILFAGLPEQVPPNVIDLLIWLRLSMGSSHYTKITNGNLALAMHTSDSTVTRAFAEAAGYLKVRYAYQDGGRVIYTVDHPNSKNAANVAPGRYLYRVCEINWSTVKQLADTSMVILTIQAEENGEAKGILQNEDTEGRWEKQNQEVSAQFSLGVHTSVLSPMSALAARPWGPALWRRINDLYREVRRRDGSTSKKNIVLGRQAARVLRNFVETLESVGIWENWERALNLFSFWLPDHELRGLRLPTTVFVEEALLYMDGLRAWEAANPTVHLRDLPPAPPKPEEDPDVKIVTDFLHERFKVSASKFLQEIIQERLQGHDSASMVSALEYEFRDVPNTVTKAGRDLNGRVRAFFEGDHIEAALQAERDAEEERLRDEELVRNDPRLGEFAGIVYDETGFPPSLPSIARLLRHYEIDEIRAAFKEFVAATNPDRDEVRNFFEGDGASGVIYARRRRKESGAAQASAQQKPAAVAVN